MADKPTAPQAGDYTGVVSVTYDAVLPGRSSSAQIQPEGSEGEQAPEETPTDGIQQIPAQIQPQESATVAVARERLVEAIGREAVFLADQRAGQASEGLEALARAFALVTSGELTAVTETAAPSLRSRANPIGPQLDRVIKQKTEA
ncbi:hypothetical protein [Streptomyces goshikiensis]|uniref:hypothetical protein n=1 Tax=Streptomyces goshikiensis TaxID=1942 RepID=UPI0033AC19E0